MLSTRRLTAAQIADLVDGDLVGDGGIVVAGIAPLESAEPGDLSFLASSQYLPHYHRSQASIVLVGPEHRGEDRGPDTRIVVDSPRAALARVIPRMFPDPSPEWGVHSSSTIGRGTRWAQRIAIGEGATIGRDVEFGANCIVEPQAVVKDRATLGDDCRIGTQAVVETGVRLGDRVVLYPGARVGTPGYGYAETSAGHEPIRQIGGCVLGDDVELGANTTVDRGSVGDTVIGAGTKIDNLVQIAHNVRIGQRCLILAQVGVAGTTTVEDDVILAGQAGLAGHLTVGHGTRVAAQSGVIGDVEPNSTVSGYPARNHRDVLRQAAALRRLAPLTDRLELLAADDDARG